MKERYEWMSPYLLGKERIVELGAGPGLSREHLKDSKIEVTDIIPNKWIDAQVDATELPYSPDSIDVVICSHMIHHVATPSALIRRIGEVLKPGGVLLINETKASLLHRLLMSVMKNEGWSYDIEIFDESSKAKERNNPLEGNNAIADLLFNDHKKFISEFPEFSIEKDQFTETFLFLLSGGVGGEVFTIELPKSALKLFQKIDLILSHHLPSLFSLSRRIVLKKK